APISTRLGFIVHGILLVDGDRNFREALAIALRLDGAVVATAASVRDALRLLAGAAFALVAVDGLLPGADELVQALARSEACVVVTGPHPELLARAAARHGVPTLEKPFGASALAACGRGGVPLARGA
ncbi:MAG TPA: response regulator, partial [Anaeromyxobacteraceae bacterium]|nr:response regulator [Anaeromyxobacteraceae bacterium]